MQNDTGDFHKLFGFVTFKGWFTLRHKHKHRHKHKNCKCEPAQHKHKHLTPPDAVSHDDDDDDDDDDLIATAQAYLHSVHVYLHSVIQDGEPQRRGRIARNLILLLLSRRRFRKARKYY